MSERAVIGRWESDSDAPHCVTPYGSSAHPATVVRLMSVWPYPDHKHGAHGLHPTRNDMRMTRIAAAFTGITAGFIALMAVTATPTTAAPRLGDCKRVAVADQTLCLTVKGQFPYTYATESGIGYIVDGKTLVHEITHQSLTKREMHSALIGEAAAYRRYATGARAVVVNLDTLIEHHGRDAQYDVGIRDLDGKPGGAWKPRVRLDLP